MSDITYPVPSKELMLEQKKRILDRIYDHHLRLWGGSGNRRRRQSGGKRLRRSDV